MPEGSRKIQLRALRLLGQSERWLIPSDQISLPSGAVRSLVAARSRSNFTTACGDHDGFLGSGGFGAVFVGQYLTRSVAIKLSLTDSLRELPSEMRLLRWLRHPNIVTFYGACMVDMGDDNTEIALVEELVRGQSLARMCKDNAQMDRFDCEECCEIMLGVCSALAYLHVQSPAVVHGDLKPDNILVEQPGMRPKLIDFGLSRMQDDKGLVPGRTQAWAAPEVLSKKVSHPTCAADIFSFGRIVFYVATGKRLSREQVFAPADATGLSPLPWLERSKFHAFKPVCDACLCVDPSRRSTAQVVLDQLHHIQGTRAAAAAARWENDSMDSSSEQSTPSCASVGTYASNMSSLRSVLLELRSTSGSEVCGSLPFQQPVRCTTTRISL
eukprot:TRINITY_DN7672_c0_g2_i1.p1 TRINITY_DN7672_c0_g2~~TRINITY_DN7672_c0_g2_i1.p1  ORF type:complete len:438 (+),score=52.82 TRINITY_DN7672_c0_g2_i1:164-1315(+)